jgi:IMP dehydrogenase
LENTRNFFVRQAKKNSLNLHLYMKHIQEALTFDDVLLVPSYSEVVPTEVDTTGFFTKSIKLKEPVISSAMDTVTESKMAIALGKMGALGVIHKNLSIEKQSSEVATAKKAGVIVAAAIGATGDYFERAESLVKAGVDALVVDTAHGHSKRVIEAVKKIKRSLKVQVVAGNVATFEGAKALIAAGVDAVKVGIGPGSICTTRMVSGCGVPQIYAIQEAVRAARTKKIPVIADGGIKYSGDITKAIAAGASCVMIGSLFAGTEEAPGEVFEEHGRQYKSYRGMGSLGAMNEGSKDRYGQEKVVGGKLVPEGVEARVPYKGSVVNIIEQLTGGLRSGMGYCGAKNILELQKTAKFVRITGAGLRESHVHDVQIVKHAPNYKVE